MFSDKQKQYDFMSVWCSNFIQNNEQTTNKALANQNVSCACHGPLLHA